MDKIVDAVLSNDTSLILFDFFRFLVLIFFSEFCPIRFIFLWHPLYIILYYYSNSYMLLLQKTFTITEYTVHYTDTWLIGIKLDLYQFIFRGGKSLNEVKKIYILIMICFSPLIYIF